MKYIKISRKGFFFTLATLIVLGYILTSITLWTKSMAIAEREYSEKFRMSNMEIVLDQISQENVEKFSNIAAYRAIYAINEISKSEPLRKGDAAYCDRMAEDDAFRKRCYYYVTDAFWNAFSNATVNPDDFESVISRDSELANKGISFADWFGSMNSTISESGLQLEKYSLSDFALDQDDLNSFNYSFKLSFSVKDNSGLAHIERNYAVKGKFYIDGLVDPAVYRVTNPTTVPIEKQFFFLLSPSRSNTAYEEPSDVVPTSIASGISGTEGQGWFYGQVITTEEAESSSVYSRNASILMGTYEDIIKLSAPLEKSRGSADYNQFGAYIVTSVPQRLDPCGGVSQQGKDTTFNAIGCDSDGYPTIKGEFMEKPYILIPGLSVSELNVHTYQSPIQESKIMVLFVNQYGPEYVRRDPAAKYNSEGALYDMEKLRDMAICGYYVHNAKSPSYFQRLFSDSYSLNDEKFGMESFAFGTWIGGVDIESGASSSTVGYSDDLSRLDRELFTFTDGSKVKGMPGAKTFAMCNADSPIGHFHLVGGNDGSANDYLGGFMSKILCADSSCAGGWSE
ncbi:MAG: hypothetical protein WCT31_04270 [Candidatus Micrarchaeia archaeon]|jgi:hypothetical protein